MEKRTFVLIDLCSSYKRLAYVSFGWSISLLYVS